MEKYSEDDIKEAKDFAEFYIDLIENHRESFSYHLSGTAILDWFGQTVKGVKNIGIFLKNNVANVKHIFPNIEPCQNIGYRDSHVVKYSSPRESLIYPALKVSSEEKTPPSNVINPGSSKKKEEGQGDGLHNCNAESPAKKSRLNDDIIEAEEMFPLQISNITSDGHIEFRRRSSKKYQRETKWSRPCKFQVAFSRTPTGYLIHLIIYQGNMRCRRNLLKDFDSAEEKD